MPAPSAQKSAHEENKFHLDDGHGFVDDEAFYGSKKTGAEDRKQMHRMGKPQELSVRNAEYCAPH